MPGTRIVLLVLLAACTGWAVRIGDPFVYPHEANDALYALAAKNHLRLGLAATKGANCVAVAGEEVGPDDFYVNHPGTLSLAAAASFLFFGEAEWAARLVPALASAAAILLLARAAARRWDEWAAVWAAGFAAAAPAMMYYGKLVNFEPVVLPFGVLLLDRYDAAVSAGARLPLHASIAAFAATAIDPACAGPLLAGIFLAYGPRRIFLPPLVAAAAAFALWIAQSALAVGKEGVRAAFAEARLRASGVAWTDWARVQFLDHLPNATLAPLGAALFLLALFAACARRFRGDRISLAALLWGLGYLALFRQAAMVHDYWQFLLLPSAAWFGARLFAHIPRWLAAAVLVALAVQSAGIVRARYYGDAAWYAQEFAAIRFARENAAPGDVVLTKKEMRTRHPQYYADVEFRHTPDLGADFAVARKE